MAQKALLVHHQQVDNHLTKHLVKVLLLLEMDKRVKETILLRRIQTFPHKFHPGSTKLQLEKLWKKMHNRLDKAEEWTLKQLLKNLRDQEGELYIPIAIGMLYI